MDNVVLMMPYVMPAEAKIPTEGGKFPISSPMMGDNSNALDCIACNTGPIMGLESNASSTDVA